MSTKFYLFFKKKSIYFLVWDMQYNYQMCYLLVYQKQNKSMMVNCIICHHKKYFIFSLKFLDSATLRTKWHSLGYILGLNWTELTEFSSLAQIQKSSQTLGSPIQNWENSLYLSQKTKHRSTACKLSINNSMKALNWHFVSYYLQASCFMYVRPGLFNFVF